MGIARDLGLWLWRLLPANPILVRVVSNGGKRTRHLLVRVLYLVALFAVMVLGGKFQGNVSMVQLAKDSTQTFMWVSLVQLFLTCFIAPVFTAGAITQEKDANTFHILLTTPLSSAQIVLGSLFSRLYFVWVLLLAGLPIFCITMIYGGVTQAEVFESLGLAACTAFVTGALAIMISVVKVGTRRTIFSFFAGLAVYLLGGGAIGLSSYGVLPEAPPGNGFLGDPTAERQMSWLAPVHPLLALLVVTGQTPAPSPADVHHYGWPWRWLLANPAYGYMLLASGASIAMILISLFFVRRSTKEGELSLWMRVRARFLQHPHGERRRRPRHVWSNPIAWREAATRASTGGRSTLRWLFLIGGLVAGGLLLILFEFGSWGLTVGFTRAWLTVLVWIELAVILLVVTNTAATTLTRERESLTLELLLASPLTSHYIIGGMWRGLVSFALPLIAVPTLTLLFFVAADLRRFGGQTVVSPEALLFVPPLLMAFAALAAMIGLQFSLNSKKTVQAVMFSTAVVLGSSGLLWVCGAAFGQANELLAAAVLPFTPFHAVQVLVDYQRLFDAARSVSAGEVARVRIARCVSSLLAAAAYLMITYALYKNLVRNFDMTVRKQSA